MVRLLFRTFLLLALASAIAVCCFANPETENAKKGLPDKSSDAEQQRSLDAHENALNAQTNELVLPESKQFFSSVTEDTTKHLKEKQPVLRK